jgi:hypothetical protein
MLKAALGPINDPARIVLRESADANEAPNNEADRNCFHDRGEFDRFASRRQALPMATIPRILRLIERQHNRARL